MSLELEELLSFDSFSLVFKKSFFARIRIKGTNIGFNYSKSAKTLSPIFRFKKNGRNFNSKSGVFSLESVIEIIPKQSAFDLIAVLSYFDYSDLKFKVRNLDKMLCYTMPS